MREVAEKCIFHFIGYIYGLSSLLYLLYKTAHSGFSGFRMKKWTSQPPILSNKQWGNHHYITLKKQNIKLHYVDKGNRQNPLLLCLHGFPECWFSYRYQLEEFSSRFWVVAPDLRGYGDSDKPRNVSDYKFDILVQDVKDLISELGHSKCSIIAHGWGGLIASSFVAETPEVVSRLILINGVHRSIRKELFFNNRNQFMKSWYVLWFQTPFLPEIILSFNDFEQILKAFPKSKDDMETFSDQTLDAYKYYLSQPGGLKCPINYYRSSVFWPCPDMERKITIPTLIIWGNDDPYLIRETSKRMTQVCSDIQLKIVDGAGHFVHEEEHVYVNKLIWDYIEITK